MERALRIIDLTHSVDTKSPSWGDECGFNLKCAFDYGDADQGQAFRVQKIEAKAGIGTHIDAPAHCFQEGATVDMLSLSKLVVPSYCIDVSLFVHETYKISDKEIIDFAHSSTKRNTWG